MNGGPTEGEEGGNRASEVPGEQIVYVVPAGAYDGRSADEINLFDICRVLWATLSRAVCAVLSIVYALSQVHWYRSEVLLVPSESRSAPVLGGQLGGLASLAGVSVGGGDSVEVIATVRSRDFAKAFIEDFNLLPVFFAEEWDDANDRWRLSDPAQQPDVRDAVKYIHDNVFRGR